jgi:DNA processing protein
MATVDDGASSACTPCLRRSWLLGELSGVLDCNSRDDGRLFALLALGDEELIAALGGRRREQLRRRYAGFHVQHQDAGGVAAICRHDRRYPAGLLHPAAPAMLHTTGGLERLRALTARPVAAFLGCSRASDYGLELARGLGRGLGASGGTVVSSCGGGVARAALSGALQANGATLAVAGDGLGVAAPAPRRAWRERVEQRGCAIGELPRDVRGRRWGANAAERIVASLADVAIVVEAEESPRALAAARLARELGKTLAACPGLVSSRASAGSHALLREGARLVSDAADVLDLLYGVDAPAAAAGGDPERRGRGWSPPPPRLPAPPRLSARLRSVLEQVGAGVDTPGKLAAGAAEGGELLQALGELESLGLLRRGDGGRYLVCEARRWHAVRYGARAQMES